jgi:putative membrane protein
MFIMIFFWIALIIGIIYFFKRQPWGSLGNKGSGGTPEDSPLETLRKRYARGEINKEEFEQKKKDLAV